MKYCRDMEYCLSHSDIIYESYDNKVFIRIGTIYIELRYCPFCGEFLLKKA